MSGRGYLVLQDRHTGPSHEGPTSAHNPRSGTGAPELQRNKSLTGTCLQPCEILSLELSPAELGLLTHRCSEIMNGAFLSQKQLHCNIFHIHTTHPL